MMTAVGHDEPGTSATEDNSEDDQKPQKPNRTTEPLQVQISREFKLGLAGSRHKDEAETSCKANYDLVKNIC